MLGLWPANRIGRVIAAKQIGRLYTRVQFKFKTNCVLNVKIIDYPRPPNTTVVLVRHTFEKTRNLTFIYRLFLVLKLLIYLKNHMLLFFYDLFWTCDGQSLFLKIKLILGIIEFKLVIQCSSTLCYRIRTDAVL